MNKLEREWGQPLAFSKKAIDLPRLPETAGDWELYVGKPGAERAAKAITAALVEARKIIDASPTLKSALTAHRAVEKVLNRYSNLGATDGEPDQHLCSYLAQYLVAVAGFGSVREIYDQLR